MKRCKICKDKFKPTYSSFEKTCLTPSCILEFSSQEKAKSWNKEKKVLKDKLKTNSDHVKDLQVIFNKFIRARDKGLNCISCSKQAKKENAGHYRSAGGNPELRFEELNCHLQCEYCNTYLHANLINYRINLIKKIGLEKVEWLEGNHKGTKYSIPELKELKVIYRLKIKQL